jgi:uncharacterized membrane protein
VKRRPNNESAEPARAPLSRGQIILYALAASFCLFGLADATYLTVLALTGETAACSGQTGCFEVLGSAYARVAGIPVAALGVAGYFSAFTFAIFAAFNYARARMLFILTVSLLFVVTLWLLYVQAFLLHAFCRYCLFSAAIVFLLMGLVVASPSPRAQKN